MVLSVSEQTFSQEVLESSQPTLVHFWAPWCGLCRMIKPSLLHFQSEWNRHIKIVGVNADENFKLANAYRLTNLPTLILFDQGQVVYRIEGLQGREELCRTLEKAVVNLIPNLA
ncbi:MAG: thiol reductase thioredoxin [Cyanobacteria bacterium QH_2_48_84]|nr:MAG: thiol reductase thioredoxin [Cyanobacteria bacterium QH_2_48_84]